MGTRMNCGIKVLLCANLIVGSIWLGSGLMNLGKSNFQKTQFLPVSILDEKGLKAFKIKQQVLEKKFSCFKWFPMSEEEAQVATQAILKIAPNSQPKPYEQIVASRYWISFKNMTKSQILLKEKQLETLSIFGFEVHKSQEGFELVLGPFENELLAKKKLGIILEQGGKGAGLYAEKESTDWGVRFGPWPITEEEKLVLLANDLPGSKLSACKDVEEK